MVWYIIAISVLGFVVWFFWRRKPDHYFIGEMLKQTAEMLGAKEIVFKKYPTPMLRGNYFGYKIALEGRFKKGFCILAVMELPEAVGERVFIQNERRKTSLKPIAELKWVTTGDNLFDATFLLLAGEPTVAQAVFQPYLCGKILSQNLKDWQLDIHGKEAYFDLQMETLDAKSLADLLSVVFEILNALNAASASSSLSK